MNLEKPLYGKPCNGCGLCCLMEQCWISHRMFGAQARCPALVDTGARYACGLIMQPDLYFKPGHEAEGATSAGMVLGIGTYCDAINSDEDFAAERELLERRAREREAARCANG